MINYSRISKPKLRDATFTRRSRELLCWLKKWLISGNLAIWIGLVLEKKNIILCFWVPREINLSFGSKSQRHMFLLVSGRHVGAHLGGHQHGVSIQISINLGKKFLRISSIRTIAATWILARVFAYLPSFFFSDSERYLLNGFDFDYYLFRNDVTLKTSNGSMFFHWCICYLIKTRLGRVA